MITTTILSICTVVFGSTSVVSIIKFIKYKKQNDRLMESQAKQAEEDTQAKVIENEKAMIDLGELYLTKVKEMGEMINTHSDKNYQIINEKLDSMNSEIYRINEIVSIIPHMKEFLDGPFDEFVKQKQKKKTKSEKK